MEISEHGFVFSDNKDLLQLDAIHRYLSKESYWAKNIPKATVKKSLENSLCFGIYKGDLQIGFSRWVTDKATFAYLCDVYIEREYRGLAFLKN